MPIDCFDNCPDKQCPKNGHDVKKDMKCHNIDKAYEKNKDIICPVCGFYCLGKGGRGCIDKPSLCGLDFEKKDSPWIDFKRQKPQANQMCIVAAGPCRHAQILAVIWHEYEKEFVWANEDLGLDPFPTEVATHWMPFPADPGCEA